MKPVYTVAMVALLAALGTYVMLFESKPVAPEATASSKPKAQLLTLARKDLQSIELDQNNPSQSVKLEQKAGKWLLDGKPTEGARMDTLLTELENWQAADTLDPAFAGSKASDFGLEPADLILRLNFSGGKQELLKIGSKTPTNSGYYLLKQGDPALYLVYVNLPEDLHRLITQPPFATPAPKPLIPKSGVPASQPPTAQGTSAASPGSARPVPVASASAP